MLATEALTENQRRAAMQWMQRANQANNEQAQAEASLAGLDRENERLAEESNRARHELDTLGQQRGQIKITFEDVTARLKRLETEIVELRHTLETKRLEETQSRRAGDALRGELATLNGRRNSLEGLIREHSYSPDAVKKFFRGRAEQNGAGRTLAELVDADGPYTSLVEEYFREELNYIVVGDRASADAGVRLLQSEAVGRATFLIHAANAGPSATADAGYPVETLADLPEGTVPLRTVVRVRDGFGPALEQLFPKFRDGYAVPDVATGEALSAKHPHAFFVAPTGEIFHGVSLSGGRTKNQMQGPLALKHELAEVQAKLDAASAKLSQSELATVALTRDIADATGTLDAKNHERRDAERESANSGAALRQMEAEVARIQSRLQGGLLAAERNKDGRQQKQDLIARKRDESLAFESERAKTDQQIAELTEKVAALRASREELQAAAAAAAASLAGLEERRRNANANFEQTNRLFQAQMQRIAQLDAQLASASTEKQRREAETAELATHHTGLTEMRAQAIAEGETLGAEASALRSAMAELDATLRALRVETEALREQRAGLTTRSAKLSSDIGHLEETTRNDLGVEPDSLRKDQAIARIEAVALLAAEDESRTLKGRLEAMGPVNMMALEEYTETATRHGFLETQRKDLVESIENTQGAIKEIDDVSRVKFDEAFKVINDNFSLTFTKLFGGGQAFMRLTDPELANGKTNTDDSGIEIVASPPGKKLQNVLLLSGGEKALTALSLLVGIFQFQPAPFCILDEVDAPLDDTNVGRFAKLIADMAQTTQFVVITHSKRTMEQADVMYGVTMQEPGVSKIVSVSLGGRNRERAVA